MAVTSWAKPVPAAGSTPAVSFGKLSGRIIRRLKWHRKIFMLSTLLSPPKLHDENNEVGFGREYIREYFLMVMVIKGSLENELFYSASTHAHTPAHSAPARIPLQFKSKNNENTIRDIKCFPPVLMLFQWSRRADTKKGSMNFCLAFCNYLNANTERTVLALPFWIPICIGFPSGTALSGMGRL